MNYGREKGKRKGGVSKREREEEGNRKGGDSERERGKLWGESGREIVSVKGR